MTAPCSRSVAIIDDDDDVRDVLEAYLTIAGHSVRIFCSGHEFLVDAKSDEFDCLLVDHQMPGMTGLQLVNERDARGTHLPTVLITGQRDAVLSRAAAAHGVAHILHKTMLHRDPLYFVSIPA